MIVIIEMLSGLSSRLQLSEVGKTEINSPEGISIVNPGLRERQLPCRGMNEICKKLPRRGSNGYRYAISEQLFNGELDASSLCHGYIHSFRKHFCIALLQLGHDTAGGVVNHSLFTFTDNRASGY